MNGTSAKLGEIASIRMGETLIKKDLTGKGRAIFSADESSIPWAYSENTKLKFSKGTIVLGARGTLGSLKIPDMEEFTCTQTTIAITPDKRIMPKFLYYFLKSYDFQRIKEGVGIPMISIKNLQKVIIPMLSIEDQQKIISLLEGAEKIKIKRAEANKELGKTIPALFHQMFGGLDSSAKGWKKVPLSECVKVGTGLVDPKREEYSSKIQIGSENIVSGTGELIDLRSAKEKRVISGNFLFTKEHVLYSKIRPYLNKVAYPQFDGLSSAEVYPLLPQKDTLDPIFLVSVLTSDNFLSYADSLSQRLRMPKLNREQLGAYQIILPPMELQKEFSEKVKQIQRLKSQQKESALKIDELFSALIEKAFI